MNTLKIFSILLFSFISFAGCIIIARKVLKEKKGEKVMLNNEFIKISAIFIAVSIILNLLFQKVIYLYDLIGKYLSDDDLIKIISIGKFNYGFSKELLKVSSTYMALGFVWIFVISLFSSLIAQKFLDKNTLNYKIFEGIILICFAVAFYSVLSFILDNFYIVLEMPTIN